MSTLVASLTPGYVWQEGETWSADKANLAALPTINVSGSVGSLALGPGAVVLSNLATGIFTNSSAGRAPFSDQWLSLNLVGNGIFTANDAGHAPFANGWLPLSLVGANIFTANTLGRAPFNSGWANAAMLQPDAYFYAGTNSGTGAAMVVAFSPTLTSYLNDAGTQKYSAYWDGLMVTFKTLSASDASSGSVTLNAGLGAKPIYTSAGRSLFSGDIPAYGVVTVQYNSTLNSGVGGWQLVSPLRGGDTRQEYTTALSPITSAAQVVSVTNLVGVTPKYVRWVLKCTTAVTIGSTTYAIGDEIDCAGVFTTNFGMRFSTFANASYLKLATGGGYPVQFNDFTAGGYQTLSSGQMACFVYKVYYSL